jgi:DNA-binding transcriptional regulator YiaG
MRQLMKAPSRAQNQILSASLRDLRDQQTRSSPRSRQAAREFASLMKALRVQCAVKQLCLAIAVGRTDAAVSMWESGKRVPGDRTLLCIIDALAEAGASKAHLAALAATWRKAKLRQSGHLCSSEVERSGPSEQSAADRTVAFE